MVPPRRGLPYGCIDRYPFHQEGDVRVLFKIAPRRVATIATTMPELAAAT